MNAVQQALLDLLDLIDAAPETCESRCTCGWRSEEFDNEADSSMAGWNHAVEEHPDEPRRLA